MSRRKTEKLELRYYQLPPGSRVLALLGEAWVGVYGQNDSCLHFHNLFEIGCCRSGRGTLQLDAQALSFTGGMFSAIPANYPHSTFSDGVASWEYLFFDPADLLREMYPDDPKTQAERLAALNSRAGLFQAEEAAGFSAAVRGIMDESRERRPYRQEVIQSLLRLCLLELIRLQEGESADTMWTARSGAAISQIAPALRYIDANYMHELCAADLARRCGLSEPHLRRLFREQVNMSPIDYLNLVRIRGACRLLEQKDSPMELVAAACGFSSVSTFTRNFKKFLDTTPYQWKLQSEKKDRLRDASITVRRGWDSV